MNPTSLAAPAKLRIAFEAAPFALLVERAGGKSSDGITGGSILDVKISAVDQRTPLCIGSANEVARFNKCVLSIKETGDAVDDVSTEDESATSSDGIATSPRVQF